MTDSKITLVSREGGANKQYTAWIEEKGGGYLVQAQWGPVGGWVQTGTKTPAPVPLEKARKILEKLLAEKRAKGYVQGADAPAFSQVEGAIDSGLRPMLLTPDDEENVEKYLKNDSWGAQQKMNGKHIMIRITGTAVTGPKVVGANKRGLECAIPDAVAKALSRVYCTLDGEMIGDVYHAFDTMDREILDLHMSSRMDMLYERLRFVDDEHIKIASLVAGEKDKRKLYESLKIGRKEGIVFKKLYALYEPGKREDLKKAIAVKVKFWSECDVVIAGWNGDKMSVKIQAQGKGEDHGSRYDTFEAVDVGNVTIPAKYKKQIAPGKILRVRYLFASDANQLYQPKVDPTDDGQIVREKDWDGKITKVADLKHEGKNEE